MLQLGLWLILNLILSSFCFSVFIPSIGDQMAAPPVASSTKKQIHKFLKNHSDKELEKLGTRLQLKDAKVRKIEAIELELIALKGGLMELDQLSYSRKEEKDALATCEGWGGKLVEYEGTKKEKVEEVVVRGGRVVSLEAP